jgi:hypothetical protein
LMVFLLQVCWSSFGLDPSIVVGKLVSDEVRAASQYASLLL